MAPLNNKKKILCLHGDGTNATIFAAQTRQLRRALQPHGIELLYVSGPFECPAGFGVSPFFDDCGPFFRWYPRDEYLPDSDENIVVAGAAETINDLRFEFGDERDVFDGILGFSSAAGVAAGILGAQSQTGEGDSAAIWYRFRFGVIVNGTGMPVPFGSKASTGQDRIEVPTVGVIGTADQFQDQSRQLIGCFADDMVTILEYENVHVVPSEQEQVEEIVREILKVAC